MSYRYLKVLEQKRNKAWLEPSERRRWLELDPWKTKKGKARTWAGHLKVLSKLTGLPIGELKKRAGL